MMQQEPQGNILHIDDDEANRYAVKKILERSGFEVTEAATAAEGFSKLAVNPDLVILDINLPDMNGFEVCRRIKADSARSSTPVLQMSASFVQGKDKIEGLESGADGYLTQPLEPGVLIATVRSLLRIRRAERAAQAAANARDQLLAVVSHDLRNPLTSVDLQVSMLARRARLNQIDSPQVEDTANKIKRVVNRMTSLIEDLLDLAKLEAGNLQLNRSECDAAEVVREAIEVYEPLAAEKGVFLEYTASEIPYRVECDKERIQQVLSNLIGNAVKFTPETGRVQVAVEENADQVVFSVRDTGPGIPPEQVSRIFEPYWQGDPTSRKSLGLGLSIARGIIRGHGGEISVESKAGQGSLFRFQLPRSV